MDFKIVHIAETDSTNRWLRETEMPEREDNLVVAADYQTAGRGCGKNSWESEQGKNLTFSLMIHPEELPASRQFHITEVVSVALCRTLARYINNKVEIKWPNDIYVDDHKICGILIENRLQGATIKDCIIGIGLNVNQTAFLSDAPNPISLCQLRGEETSLDELLMAFLDEWNLAYDDPQTGEIYRERLYRRGVLSPFRSGEEAFMATIKDVEPGGLLVVEDEAGKERRFAFKEIEFLGKLKD